MYAYTIGQTYNFNTLAPAILGASFQNSKLVGMLSYDQAVKYTNIDQQAQIVYPALPQGTPTDPTSYIYLVFETSAQTTVVLANVWINETTIAPSSSTTITVVIAGVTLADVQPIRNQLLQMGYTQLTMTTA